MSRVTTDQVRCPPATEKVTGSKLSTADSGQPNPTQVVTPVPFEKNKQAILAYLKKRIYQEKLGTYQGYPKEVQDNALAVIGSIEKLMAAVVSDSFPDKTDLRDLRAAISTLLRVPSGDPTNFFTKVKEWDGQDSNALTRILSDFFTTSEGKNNMVGISIEAGRVLKQLGTVFLNIQKETNYEPSAFQSALRSLQTVVNNLVKPIEERDITTNAESSSTFWREQGIVEQRTPAAPPGSPKVDPNDPKLTEETIRQALEQLNKPPSTKPPSGEY